jgi:hypothetical protein
MPLQPCLDLLAGVHSKIVTDDVDHGDREGRLAVDFGEQFDEILLPLSRPATPITFPLLVSRAANN